MCIFLHDAIGVILDVSNAGQSRTAALARLGLDQKKYYPVEP